MTTKIEELWDSARGRKARGTGEGQSVYLRLSEEEGADLYAGVDDSDYPLIALGTSKRPPSVNVSAGALDCFRTHRSDGSWLLTLRLRQTGLEPVFGRLCQDLCEVAASMRDEAALLELFKQRLALWVRLFREVSDGLLGTAQVMGLIGELFVLERLAKCSESDLLEVVAGWEGPLGSDQDFVLAQRTIEVKAIGASMDAVRIASLAQLDSKVPMHLVVIELRQVSSASAGALTLNALVARIESVLSADAGALSLFRSRLLEAGYVEHVHYDTMAYAVADVAWHAVVEGFPKLLAATVPQGVIAAGYSISRMSIADFRVQEPA
jgi:hypothetical protein